MRWLTAAAIVVSAALAGLAAWVVGLAGLANRAESICFADLDNRLGYGADQISRKLWSLSFECRLLGNSVDPIGVQHPLETIVTFGWVVVVPSHVLYAIASLVFALRWARQTRPTRHVAVIHGKPASRTIEQSAGRRIFASGPSLI